jgi:DNA modification methylase
LADINAGVDLGQFWSGDELDAILGDLAGGGTEGNTEPQTDKAAELVEEWGTAVGQVWELGPHRLAVGDCTDPAVVEAVMRGERADLVFTSPPYAGGNNSGYKTDYYGKAKKFYTHNRDNITPSEWLVLCNDALNNIKNVCHDDTPVVLNIMYNANNRDGYGRLCFAGSHPFTVKETICWDKGAGFPSASKGILSRNWELVFVLSIGEKYRTTQQENEPRWAKWDIQRPKEQNELHKATFPIELPERVINDFGGKNILDIFTGSGTTIIAAHNLGRIARAIEIDPGYAAVCLDRFHRHTGITPERL